MGDCLPHRVAALIIKNEWNLEMAQTNAQRQAAYRKRHSNVNDPENQLVRINTMVSTTAKAKLSAMAKHYGVTEWKILENIISDAENGLRKSLSAQQLKNYQMSKEPHIFKRNISGAIEDSYEKTRAT